jgi:hypothetical protein
MLLYLNFCIEWFDSNSKDDSKSFGKYFEMLWKEKKEKSFLSSLLSAHVAHVAQQTTARPCPFPRFPLGQSPASAAGPARVSARAFLSLRVADTPGPQVDAAAGSSFPKIADAESPSLSSPFLTRCTFGLYKPRAAHSRLHLTLSQHQPGSRDAITS